MASISAWYRSLQPRILDLVGDYAGQELFLIEGDSLLLECFSDTRIDFDDGFQLLHAVYAVESFLENFLRRKCNFHVAFFEDHQHVSVPATAAPAAARKYSLARSILKRHLKASLEQSHPNIEIHEFSSIEDSTFQTYLDTNAVYFIMCHDAAGPMGKTEGEMSPDTKRIDRKKKHFMRVVIKQLLSQGISIALINGLELRDTKIMAMIIEGGHLSKELASDSTVPADAESPSDGDEESSESDSEDSSDSLEDDILGDQTQRIHSDSSAWLEPGLSTRDKVTIRALSVLLSLNSSETFKALASAFVLHTALLETLSLSQRRIPATEAVGKAAFALNKFESDFAMVARTILEDKEWTKANLSSDTCDNLADLLDGRLFRATCLAISRGLSVSDPHSKVQQQYRLLVNRAEKTIGEASLTLTDIPDIVFTSVGEPDPSRDDDMVLPFNNAVFDKHLASIKIAVDSEASKISKSSAKTYQEKTHWHNPRKLLDPKGPRQERSKWAEARLLRSNQRFMADMAAYAASLTNAVGKSLEPEIIITQSQRGLPSSGGKNKIHDSANEQKMAKKHGKGGPSAREMIAANTAARENKDVDRVLKAWSLHRSSTLDKINDLETRYSATKAYSQSLSSKKGSTLEAEIALYSLQTLVLIWQNVCRKNAKDQDLHVAALVWDATKNIHKERMLSEEMAQHLFKLVSAMHLPPLVNAGFRDGRSLTFKFKIPEGNLDILRPPQEFQLVHAGPYIDRSVDSAEDTRVRFVPDGWQRRVLDQIDAGNSLFVVAPTSAGKTFISFYAMEKVLRSSDDDVLVYVAPTKALVNQIAAEIHARFSKTYKHSQGKSLWAIHTRDYRVNNPTNCQILVTVPHILQIMLLSPSNAKTWSPRLRRIIFDEIHSIGQADDGVVWEQLLLLAPCPIIALSATVGNPEAFQSWLSSTQEAAGYQLSTVIHPYRYSDLRKFIFTAPKSFEFRGLPSRSNFAKLGLDGTSTFDFFHPIASVVNRSRGMPNDLNLEARDLFTLSQEMARQQTPEFPFPRNLLPERFLPETEISKADLIRWEDALKSVFLSWMADTNSPWDKVVVALGRNQESPAGVDSRGTIGPEASVPSESGDDLLSTTLPLLAQLEEVNALPAILFNYDRLKCEEICKSVLNSLESAESRWKQTSKKWQKQMEEWEAFKKTQRAAEKAKPSKAQTAKKGKKKGGDEGEEEANSALDSIKDTANAQRNPLQDFDPDEPCENFHFAGKRQGQASELKNHFRTLRRMDVPEWLLQALLRGIGVHHAGMNRKYRQVVEMFFRRGFLRVVIATGTLSLGINMPCVTVVFSGDSLFLTALNFRQAAGRAGRRGFDYLGNVVFQNISQDKACRLLSSRLPDLNGHFPVTTSLILRLFTLLHGSNNAPYSVKAIDSLLSQPRLYLGGASFKEQVLHHLRFSIEYLRRQGLLGSSGEPLNFASCVSHLYYVENSSFAFHALLKGGFFHRLCANVDESEEQTLRTLMLVMANLFGRRPCRQADIENVAAIRKKSPGSPSIVFLPAMPAEARSVLEQHNAETLRTFATYVRTFAAQHLPARESKLPLSGMAVGSESEAEGLGFLNSLPPTVSRSAFVALSGHGDSFASIADLCSSARQGVFLEQSVIPHLETESRVPLNAYLYDFYQHSSLEPLAKANGIRKSDVWFLLNDFSMVLATIVTSLVHFMNNTDGGDEMDMLDVLGDGDTAENTRDEEAAEREALEQEAIKNNLDSSRAAEERSRPKIPAKKPKKTAVADDWEAEAELEEHSTWDSATEGEGKGSTSALPIRDGKSQGTSAPEAVDVSDKGLEKVLRAMQLLKEDFDTKFRSIWA